MFEDVGREYGVVLNVRAMGAERWRFCYRSGRPETDTKKWVVVGQVLEDWTEEVDAVSRSREGVDRERERGERERQKEHGTEEEEGRRRMTDRKEIRSGTPIMETCTW